MSLSLYSIKGLYIHLDQLGKLKGPIFIAINLDVMLARASTYLSVWPLQLKPTWKRAPIAEKDCSSYG